MVPRPNSVRVLRRITFVVLVVSGCLHAQTSRWTEERAKAWYGQQAWLVGSNYIPDDAINELEMWQSQSFNPGQIDRELGWAEDLGMNTMRVLGWDVWNEPSNVNEGSYHRLEPANKRQLVEALLPKVFSWAREAHPSQPLTSGVWDIDFMDGSSLTPTQRVQIDNSDVITFH